MGHLMSLEHSYLPFYVSSVHVPLNPEPLWSKHRPLPSPPSFHFIGPLSSLVGVTKQGGGGVGT